MYVLKLWEFARLFAAMGVCKSGLSSTQKLNSTETLLLDTTRVNTTFSQWLSFNFVSALQFTVQMSKLNGLGKTYWKRICSRAENFTHPFTTNKREFTEYIDLAKPKSRASVSLFSGPSLFLYLLLVSLGMAVRSANFSPMCQPSLESINN